MSLSLILLIVLILILIGALPTWGHSRSWGYGPSGGIGLVDLQDSFVASAPVQSFLAKVRFTHLPHLADGSPPPSEDGLVVEFTIRDHTSSEPIDLALEQATCTR